MGVSLTGVVIAIYWAKLGFSAPHIGILTTFGLLGGAAATLAMSFWADSLGRRNSLLLLALFSIGGAVALMLKLHFLVLCGAVFLGMVNGMGRDRLASFSIEQSILSSVSTVHERTKAFAWYSLVMDIGHALGSLLGSLPFLLRTKWAVSEILSYQAVFAFYGFLLFVCMLCYLSLSRKVEVQKDPTQKISKQSQKRVMKFAGISFLDALGGGFLTSALVSYWFYKKFGVTEEVIGLIFFGARIANAVSFLGAAWLAKKIGLVNTMVFTHIPSNIVLMLVAFAPSLWMAILFYLIRESFVEMDVPTRQSYIASIVEPHERTFAIGILNVTRTLGWGLSPALAGQAMKGLSLSAPFFIGSSIKIFYDLILYKNFRHISEEDPSGLRPSG